MEALYCILNRGKGFSQDSCKVCSKGLRACLYEALVALRVAKGLRTKILVSIGFGFGFLSGLALGILWAMGR